LSDYRLVCDFDVLRRIGWSDDELGLHIDDVFDRLRQSSEVTSVESEADLDTGRTALTVGLQTWELNKVQHGKTVLSVAIRAAGAQHQGIFSVTEEAKLFGSKSGSWSPLRGASWRLRKAGIEHPGDE
jgi:hypothetical protein